MKEVKFPSGFKRVLGAWDPGYQGRLVEYDGYRWHVGVEEGEYPVLLEDLVYYYPLVIKYLGLEGREIAVSIPAETFLKDKDTVSLMKERIEKETGARTVVYPQGIIALAGLEIDTRGGILVLDGGFNTLNAAIVDREGEDIKVKWLKTYYNELGVRDLLEKYFREELLRKFSEVPNNFQLLSRIFTRGYVDTGFKKVDVSAEKNVSLEVFLNLLLRRLRGDVARAERDVNLIVVVGGLGYYFKDLKIESTKEILVPEQVEFANVRGMYAASGLPSVDFGFGQVKAILTD